MCLCLAIKSVSAFARFHCVVAVVFGSAIVTGSEATQKCFCEISAPHSPVVRSRRKVGPSLPCCGGASAVSLLWSLRKDHGVGARGGRLSLVSLFCPKKSC